jgi:hypothetical protein
MNSVCMCSIARLARRLAAVMLPLVLVNKQSSITSAIPLKHSTPAIRIQVCGGTYLVTDRMKIDDAMSSLRINGMHSPRELPSSEGIESVSCVFQVSYCDCMYRSRSDTSKKPAENKHVTDARRINVRSRRYRMVGLEKCHIFLQFRRRFSQLLFYGRRTHRCK